MPLDIDTSPLTTAPISAEASRILMQVEEVYQTRKDKLGELSTLLEKTPRICLGDTTIDDPKVIKGVKVGLLIAKDIFGKFPVKIEENEEVNGDENE